jgi:hypothetical protein
VIRGRPTGQFSATTTPTASGPSPSLPPGADPRTTAPTLPTWVDIIVTGGGPDERRVGRLGRRTTSMTRPVSGRRRVGSTGVDIVVNRRQRPVPHLGQPGQNPQSFSRHQMPARSPATRRANSARPTPLATGIVAGTQSAPDARPMWMAHGDRDASGWAVPPPRRHGCATSENHRQPGTIPGLHRRASARLNPFDGIDVVAAQSAPSLADQSESVGRRPRPVVVGDRLRHAQLLRGTTGLRTSYVARTGAANALRPAVGRRPAPARPFVTPTWMADGATWMRSWVPRMARFSYFRNAGTAAARQPASRLPAIACQPLQRHRRSAASSARRDFAPDLIWRRRPSTLRSWAWQLAVRSPHKIV